MSTRDVFGNAIGYRSLSARTVPPVPTQANINAGGVASAWYRNPSWLALPTVTSSDEKFVGLHVVYPDANFVALSATGDYQVDWGDGTIDTVSSGVQANHEYDFTDADLANTNAPVTFQDSGDTVTRNNHGYSNGMTISFDSITTTTGITAGQIYYVVGATTNTFQVSDTNGGSALPLTNDGSGIILPYKQAIVVVTPQSGQQLSSLNLHLKNSTSGLNAYCSGFVDMDMSLPNATDIRIAGANPGANTQTINFTALEQVAIRNSKLKSGGYLFYNCYALSSVVDMVVDTTAARSINATFTDTGDLVTSAGHGLVDGDPIVLTSLTSTTGITAGTAYYVISATTNTFQISATLGGSAVALTTDGSGAFAVGTVLLQMFQACYSLQSVPLFNTTAVTTMQQMFQGCSSLQSVPLFNTAAVTSMRQMFTSCSSLQSVPLFNTAAVTTMQQMFSNCYSLQSVPLFNTTAVTTMQQMFTSCYSLQSVPLFNTTAVTNMFNMFNACSSLQSVPLFNTTAVTTMGSMFSGCSSLQSVPLFNTAAVTTMGSMFSNCFSLQSVPLFNTAAVTTMGSMFNNCYSLQSVPLFNTTAVTNMLGMFQNCYSLQSVPALNGNAATSSSGYSGIFSGCSNLANIDVTNFKYTFSVASCKLSSARLDEIYTNLPTVTGQTITVTGNYGTTGDDPSIATAKGWTVTG